MDLAVGGAAELPEKMGALFSREVVKGADPRLAARWWDSTAEVRIADCRALGLRR